MATKEQLLQALRAAHEAGNEEDARAIANMYKAMDKPKKSWGDVPGEALSNFPKSALGVAKNLAGAVIHPIDTTQGVLDLANGVMQKALPQSLVDLMPDSMQGNEAKADALGQLYKQRYGSSEGLKEAISNDPASVLMDLSTIVSAGQGLANVTGLTEKLGSKLAASEANAAKINALNAPTARIIEEGIKSGYKVPPSAVNPSWLNKRLESISGKAAVGQQAAAENQAVTNALTRQALGIADDQPILNSVLEGIRTNSGQAYKDVAALPVAPSLANGYSVNSRPQTLSIDDLEAMKQARNDAQGWYKAARRSGSPDDLAKAKVQDAIAKQLDAQFQNRAAQVGTPEIMDNLYNARRDIAKTYTVDNARNVASGDISAPIIGRMLDKDVPLSGELKQIGEFANRFPQYVREGEKIPTPGVSKSEALTALLLGAAGTATTGGGGVLLGSLPLLSTPVRNMVLSAPYQKLMAKVPKAEASSILKKSAEIFKPSKNQAIINAIYQSQQGDN